MPPSDYVSVPSQATAIDNDDVVVDDSVGGVTLLEANKSRSSALIVNVGDVDMRVTTDGSVPTATHGKPVSAGSYLALSSPDCPTAEVKGFAPEPTTANASEVV